MTYPQQMLEEVTDERDALRARVKELEAAAFGVCESGEAWRTNGHQHASDSSLDLDRDLRALGALVYGRAYKEGDDVKAARKAAARSVDAHNLVADVWAKVVLRYAHESDGGHACRGGVCCDSADDDVSLAVHSAMAAGVVVRPVKTLTREEAEALRVKWFDACVRWGGVSDSDGQAERDAAHAGIVAAGVEMVTTLTDHMTLAEDAVADFAPVTALRHIIAHLREQEGK